ncbi:hypothetical protein AB834_05505 [PVC group bacterium (ex Bugula neritina AB1)]|nr:hypothetical protein AB834_05505 [PVC group bacterium (ex Bugula neritina AB1)]
MSRVVCVSCIDGRIHDFVFKAIARIFPDTMVDLITEPGPDAFLTKPESTQSLIWDKIDLSIDVNSSKAIICIAHEDCKGHAVSKDQHKLDLEVWLKNIKDRYPKIPSHAFWIENSGLAEEVGSSLSLKS